MRNHKKINKNIVLDRSGFTIANILVGIVLMGIVTAGMMGTLSMMSRESKGLSSRLGKQNLAQDIRSLMANSQNCTSALNKAQTGQGLVTSPSELKGGVTHVSAQTDLVIDIGSSTPMLIGANQEVSPYNVFVQRLYASGVKAAGLVEGKPLYVADLVLETREIVGRSTASDARSFKATHAGNVYFTLVSATDNTIDSCYSMESSTDLLRVSCEKGGGVYDEATRTCDTITNNLPELCNRFGGTLSGSMCVVRPSAAESCATLGGSFNGSKCNMGQTTCDLAECRTIAWNNCETPWEHWRTACANSAHADSSAGAPIPGTVCSWGGVSGCGSSVCQVDGRWGPVKKFICPSNDSGGGGGYSSSCFTIGTKVKRHDGVEVPIEQIRIGDQVLSREGKISTVINIENPSLGDRKLYSFNGEGFFVTSEHPFWTPEGWKSLDPRMTAYENPKVHIVGALKAGDHVLRFGKWVELKSIDRTEAPSNTILYNLILDNDHTYFADGYLVHNKNDNAGGAD